eukprot:jgi/Tetstr1/465881/TSEL_010498.t1
MMDPNIPEFCAYVRIILGLPSELAILPPDLAKGVYRSLQLPDTAGLLALSTHVDPAVLALLQLMALNGVGLMFNGQGGMRNLTGQMLPTLDPKFEPSTATAEMFHLDSFREMRFRFSGQHTRFRGQPTLRFTPEEELLQPCGVSEANSRCFFDDNMEGVFNMTFLYLAETILTSPHFYGSDPALMRSLEPAEDLFQEDEESFSWYIDFFARTGFPYKINTPIQRSHLVKPTDVMYPSLWVSNSSAFRGGMMLPLVWTTFEYLYILCVGLPVVLMVIWGITVYLSYFTASARHNVAILNDLRARKSPPHALAEVDAEEGATYWWFSSNSNTESSPSRESPALSGLIGSGTNVQIGGNAELGSGDVEQVLTINITSIRHSKKAKPGEIGGAPGDQG